MVNVRVKVDNLLRKNQQSSSIQIMRSLLACLQWWKNYSCLCVIFVKSINTKSKSTHYAECPISSFQMYESILKIADMLFSNGRNLHGVLKLCSVIIIKIYKVTSNSCSGVNVQYLSLRCSGVEVKSIGNWKPSSAKCKYLKIVLE